jgi:hypothetical protein
MKIEFGSSVYSIYYSIQLELIIQGILSLLVARRSPIPRGPHNPDELLYLALDRWITSFD